MPRLIPPELGNGKRPSSPAHSRGGPNDLVPILDVTEGTHELVGARHDAALNPDDDVTLVTGAQVRIDNQRPIDGSRGGVTPCGVGGSTLHEAATEVITAFANVALDMPEWVACTDEDLAVVLAEHYTVKGYNKCRVIEMSEVPS